MIIHWTVILLDQNVGQAANLRLVNRKKFMFAVLLLDACHLDVQFFLIEDSA